MPQPMTWTIWPRAGLALLALSLGGCPGGGLGALAGPGSAADALGVSGGPGADCTPGQIPPESTPLVVDWEDAARADLESAMQRGIAVVRYDCEGIKVLKGCHIEGGYRYLGVSKKTRVVQMDDKATIAANFSPGFRFVGEVEAELNAGRSLNLATIMVGQKSTDVSAASRALLQGRCDGATHFVFDATLGAFAMETGSKGEVKAAAEILNRGASAGVSADKKVEARDGDPAACDVVAGPHEAPVGGCQAVLRLTLFALSAEGEAAPTKPSATLAMFSARESARDGRTCPAGFVFTEGACVRPAAAQTFLCEVGDKAQCKAQCDKAHVGSCGRYAELLLAGWDTARAAGGAATQAAFEEMFMAREAVDAACVGGDEPAACTLSSMAEMLANQAQKGAGDIKKARDRMVRGCQGGNLSACAMLVWAKTGQYQDMGLSPSDVPTEATLKAGCAKGHAGVCALVVDILGMLPGAAGADELFNAALMACQGGQGLSCAHLAAFSAGDAECALIEGRMDALARAKFANNPMILAGRKALCSRFPKPSAAPDAILAALDRGCGLGEPAVCTLANERRGQKP